MNRPFVSQRGPFLLGAFQLVLVFERAAGAQLDADEVYLQGILIGLQLDPGDVRLARLCDRQIMTGRSDGGNVHWRGWMRYLRFGNKSRRAHGRAEPNVAPAVPIRSLQMSWTQTVSRGEAP